MTLNLANFALNSFIYSFFGFICQQIFTVRMIYEIDDAGNSLQICTAYLLLDLAVKALGKCMMPGGFIRNTED